MAKGDIEISIDANASGAIKGFKETETAAQRASRTINKGAKIAAGGFLAVGGAALVLAKGAADDQKAASALATQLRNSTGATRGQIAATEAWITKQGKLTGITDDELRPALGRLVTATGSISKAQKLALLAQNVAIGTGKDYGTIVNALVRAQNGQVAGLSRLGIKTTKVTKDTAAHAKAQIAVKTAQLAYDAAVKKSGANSAQAKIAADKLKVAHDALRASQDKTKKTTLTMGQVTKELGAKFKGQAAAQAQTLAGKMKILHTQLREAGETIGYQLIPVLTNLANFAVQKVLPAMTAVGNWMRDHKQTAIALGIAVGAFGAAFIVAATAMKVWSAASTIATVATGVYSVAKGVALALTGAEAVALEGNTVALTAYSIASKVAAAGQWALNIAMEANPVGLVVIAVIALVAAIVLAWKHSETFRAIVTGAFKAVTGAATAAFNWVKGHWPLLLAILTGPIGLAVLAIAKNWGAIKSGAATAVDWVKSKFSGLMGFFRGLPGKIGGIFSGLWSGIAGGLKGALNSVLHLPLTIPRIDTHIPGVGTVGGQTLIPALAKGGIVTRPTLALIGDNPGHKEAVIPLTGPNVPDLGGRRGITIEHVTIQAAPNEPINSTLPRAIAALSLQYGAA